MTRSLNSRATLGVLLVLAAAVSANGLRAQVPSYPTPPAGTLGSWSLEVDTGTKTAGPAPKPQAADELRVRRMAAASRWGYQLRLIDPNQISQSPFDLVVIDHAISAFRRFVRELLPDEIATIQQRPDGTSRIALSYLSIGEAERYRFYWQQEWYDVERKPAWLGDLNPMWDGNYAVQFWDPGWQRLIFGTPGSYVERVIAQGFDGIYLDRADIFQEFAKTVPDAEERMVEFLTRLIAHARRLKPDILIVMQNAEELLKYASVRSGIDAIAKEDLYYGIDHREGRNAADTVDWSVKDLMQFKRTGRPVFVVEYLSDPVKSADAERRASRNGFRLHITSRDLGQLTLEPPHAVGSPPLPPR